ncbi:MAG: class I SAM-dependent methyltransferase [Propionibacteriales bacterium]|nr:class I SAM-dependent methyltransferase [Propionibacteriales bacterium]
MLIVSHRLLIGAVAAHGRGCSDPAAIFRDASAFRLNPRPPLGHTTPGQIMTDDHADEKLLPYESEPERQIRYRFAHLLASTPIPPDELGDNLTLYLRRQPLTDLLSLDALYRMVLDVPGVIMEFGVHRGRHLAALTALRGAYEPYHPHRRIIGFDTFTGFPDVTAIDATNPSAVPGRFSLTDSYVLHLRDVLATHEAAEHLGHIRRTLIFEGDVRETLPCYLTDNPHTVIALAYFDLDLYEPTRHTIDALKPYLTRGSVLAFDQLAHAKWPGETAALRDAVGIGNCSLRCLPGRATPVYLRWGE